jgi:predicted dehydrogenase
MTLPTQYRNVWSPATDGDKLKAMAMLSPLPARKTLSAEIEDATYAIVMEDMTAYGLEQAVRAAIRGEHGSTFFPSPPDLRELYDKAMEYHERMRERIARQEQIAREREPDIPPRMTDEIARHKALMAKFYEAYEDGRKIAQERVTLDPALVAQIADAPTTWRKAG